MAYKVLFIMHMPPPVHGAAMMGKYIFESEMVNTRFDCRYLNLTTASSLEDIGRFGIKKVFALRGLIKTIRQTIRQDKPDLVYLTPNACAPAFYKDYLVARTVRKLGCRIVLHYHNKGVAQRQDRWLDDKLYNRFFKGVRVILLSERLYPDVKKYVDRANVFICPNGIKEYGEIAPKKERGITRFLFLSNMIPSKGVYDVLTALKILRDHGRVFACDFVGGETKEINAANFNAGVVKLGLDSYVQWHGQKTGKEKDAFLDSADCLLFPTFYPGETFGLVLLEAMQHGLPVITTDEGSIPDIVEDGKTGFIVPKQDPEALAAKMEFFLDNPDQGILMGENGRKKYEQEYRLEIWEDRLCRILESICA